MGKFEGVVLRALQTARVSVAVLIHTPVHRSPGPRLKVFEKHPPAVVAPLGCTVPLFKADTSDPFEQTASFTWLVWLKGDTGPPKLVILLGPDVIRNEMH